jgi:apolipoprotein D and lipocalin family protein
MSIDLEKYAGKYYEIYKQNAFYAFGCEASTAEYKVIPEGLSVLNICYSENGTGQMYTMKQPELRALRDIRGIATPTDVNGEYDLLFETGQSGLYKIFYTDYVYSMVGDLRTNYMTIISKIPYPSQKKINELLLMAEDFGFKLEK